MSNKKIDVFGDNKSFIRLLETAGDELSIINAAKVSFGKEASAVDESGKGLINFLLKNKHGSPFEHNFFAFHIKAPLFVIREWQRHRIGFSYNEISGRYSELSPDFYIPDHIRTQHGKPGAYYYERDEDQEKVQHFQQTLEYMSETAFLTYKSWLNEGIAKEQARIVLPLNLYTEIRWTCNARSLMNFLSLRNAPDAMYEIRRYAEEIEKIFAQHMPNVHSSFVNNNRIAP